MFLGVLNFTQMVLCCEVILLQFAFYQSILGHLDEDILFSI